MACWRSSIVMSVASGMPASDQKKNCSQSDCGTPNKAAMTYSGYGTHSEETMSTDSPSGKRPTISSARASSCCDNARMRDGRNAGLRIERYSLCNGASVCIIVGGDGYSMPISSGRMPPPERKVLLSTDTDHTSAWVEAIQTLAASSQTSGASARSRAYISNISASEPLSTGWVRSSRHGRSVMSAPIYGSFCGIAQRTVVVPDRWPVTDSSPRSALPLRGGSGRGRRHAPGCRRPVRR